MAKRSDMPKPKAIAEYWSNRLIEMGIEELPVSGESCFVCGAFYRLDRAHILPLCEGGTNNVDNLHLLCRSCHDESEHLHGEVYWYWYREKRETAFIHPLIRLYRKAKAIMSYVGLDIVMQRAAEIENPRKREEYLESVIHYSYDRLQIKDR